MSFVVTGRVKVHKDIFADPFTNTECAVRLGDQWVRWY
jgi:hypothetical protein